MPPIRFPPTEQTPTLREMFEQAGGGSVVALADLARRLGCAPVRLVSFVREGWLKRADGLPAHARLTTATEVEPVSAEALAWLRGWLAPARAKPLFSKADLAELLSLSEREVMMLAARAGVAGVLECGLGGAGAGSGGGVAFSAWAAKRLLIEQASGGLARRGRFDRQALLWAILEDDPARALQPPTYDRLLEEEIARVAELPEPARGVRAAELIGQWRDAKVVAEAGLRAAQATAGTDTAAASDSSAARSPSGHSPQPEPSDEFSANGSFGRISAYEQVFVGLREFR